MITTTKKRKTLWGLTLATLCGAAASMCACSLMPGFGELPEGERLTRVQASPNYRDGEFHNQTPTEMFSGESSRLGSMWKFLFRKQERLRPRRPLPVVDTDLASLDSNTDVAVWLGHSSYFLQLNGKRILIDPVFSDHAAPLSFMNRAFEGDYPFTADRLPDIDYLVISHDHWDHLDYPTLTALRSKIATVICPLGVGAHLTRWGFDEARIHEADWYDVLRLESGFTVSVLPARHFSGRGLIRRNRTLWAGFMLETPWRKVFYSGDSGYGPHFAEIGRQFGDIDLAIVEDGQYNKDWAYIHMMPEETAQSALDVRAKALLPAHAGRFTISDHPWDDPYQRLAAASEGKPFKLLTPKIGEVVNIGDFEQSFTAWWTEEGL